MMMTRFLIPICSIAIALTAQVVQATTLTFEGGANGSAVGSTYAGSGVIFDNAFFASSPYGSQNGSGTWVSGESDSGYNEAGNVSVIGHFSGVTDYVSGQIIYADFDYTTSYLDVYDSLGNWLAGTSFSSSSTPYTLSVTNSGIASFKFSWTGGVGPFDDVIGIDNFSFNEVAAPVPEPETYAMLLAGLGLLGWQARRRKLKKISAA